MLLFTYAFTMIRIHSDRLKPAQLQNSLNGRFHVMGKRGSIRQRVGAVPIDDGDGDHVEPCDDASTSRSLRRRVGAGPGEPRAQPERGAVASSSSSSSLRERVSAEAPRDHVSTFLCDDLPFTKDAVMDFARGKISAVKLLRQCSAAAAQGASGLGALNRKTLPEAGAANPNAARDAMRAIGWPPKAPRPQYIQVPFKDGVRWHPVICPIDMFIALHDNLPDMFRTVLLGEPRRLAEFWAGISGTAQAASVAHMGAEELQYMIPLGMHGDAAPWCKTQSCFTLCWTSLVGSGGTIDNHMVFTVVKKTDMAPGTLETLFEYLAWSFGALFAGKWPANDWRGLALPRARANAEFAGRWRANVVQLRGDWEFYADAVQLPRWNNDRFCFLCNASHTHRGLLWTDRNGGWRETMRSHGSWLAELGARGVVPSNIWKIGGLRLEGVMIDVLHTVDQGFASHAFGNIAWECIMQRGLAIPEAVKSLDRELVKWYRDHPTAARIQGKLTPERVRTQGDWPKLKCKAAATRHVAPFIVQLARAAPDVDTPHGQRRLALAGAMDRFYDILAESPRFLSPEAKVEVAAVGRAAFGLYAALSAEALQQRRRAWKMTAKFHMFLHVVETQCYYYGNPRYFWTYSDEDLQRYMTDIASSCHPDHLAPTLLLKWSILTFCK